MRTDFDNLLPETTVPERVVKLEDLDHGLEGVIVVHSTALGPAAGGCRLWHYPDRAHAHRDALRLAAGMSAKNALAGLPFGGGKAVIRMPQGHFDREALFAAFGRAVEHLRGEYVTAEDVGTNLGDMAAVRRRTRHVAGLAAKPGCPGGDPSPHTARGVFEAMAVAVMHRLSRPLADVTVAVQGLGNVGFNLCELLHEAGARLIVSEPRSEVAALAAARFGAEIAHPGVIHDVRADVFAPCALGGALDQHTTTRLHARVVCGAANNQLADSSVGTLLAERGVLYAPDYLVNAGGIVNVAGEYLGWTLDEVDRRVSEIAPRLAQLLARAEAEGTRTEVLADRMACEAMGAVVHANRAA
ncbi:Glu/Leu/Phe/Val dehydrogenase dimerization domain-containing protein [Oscillatoria laete-virens NRMC-F 0139]|nr:Glu/Leu/Phe/Val dehydrogenase dimerization domain-containing protein [Oscillatoria laete-virens]MDL5054811.1 Glu/Leu/Phe/Val dehydrogenase dimerization domain-containing protein [Oscillatoria laete-virens NRMC-F 0139]